MYGSISLQKHCMHQSLTHISRCLRALWYIKFEDPVDNKEKRITDVLTYVEIADGI